MYQFAWTLIALDVLLVLLWLWSLIFPRSGTDAAGRGLGQAYVLALGIYVALCALMLLLKVKWLTILATILAALPLLVALYGLLRWLRTR
ncbi:MAG: hypothetical protein KF734_01110 [Saprospiraceae bacterium]|nr:hypothetical protein [Saprospiraceae bacterium]